MDNDWRWLQHLPKPEVVVISIQVETLLVKHLLSSKARDNSLEFFCLGAVPL